jgi:release factor glutamine methyltransferase
MASPGSASSAEAAAGVTRGALVAELAELLGAPHEARFVVDEAVGLGLFLGQPDAPAGPLRPAVIAAARAMASRRAAGEPLQYVLGHWPFRSLDLLVDRRVLIPRPETEQVVEVALAEARRLTGDRGLVIVDAGTGSGAIALSVAEELGVEGASSVWAVDASADALEVAAANLETVRVQHRAAWPRVELLESDWLGALPAELRGRVDLVVANPPYVSEEEWPQLDPVVQSEPRSALVAGAASDGTAGLADVEELLLQSLDWLARPGTVVLELAPHQADAASALASRAGYEDVRVEPDLAGKSRALVARMGK